MIPVLQLDPASLSLWFNPEFIRRSSGALELQAAVWLAISGKVDELPGYVSRIDAKRLAVRAMTLASAVWHEQRHFLDLITTNFGAFRVRNYLSIYMNLQRLLKGVANDGGPLHCPLSVYTDPVRRMVAGIDRFPEEAPQLAEDISQREAFLASDSQLVPTPYGAMEVGGDAQLEALAWIFQYLAVDRIFGSEGVIAVQGDLRPSQRAAMRYFWLSLLASDLGLGHSVDLRRPGDRSPRLILDTTLLTPMIYAALACRAWGQEQVIGAHHASSLPAARLSGLIRALSGRAADTEASTARAWQMVNEAAGDLWGRTVSEEMAADLEREDAWAASD